MATRKRSSSVPEVVPDPKRRGVTVNTVEKWKRDNDKALNTYTWLSYERSDADRDHVVSLSCSVCTTFKEQLTGMRNFTAAFINGSTNLRVSSVKDHASTDMHARAMLLLKKKQGQDVCEYSPIARMFSGLNEATKERMKRKFDVAFTIAKNNMPMTKMKAITDLEERHGVDLGEGYKNNQACAVFIQYIAQDQKQILLDALSKAKFYSMQGDGSNDSGNIENELFLVVYVDRNSPDCRIRIENKFFAIQRPTTGDAEGLFDCVNKAVRYVGLDDSWSKKLIGFGCDGTAVNIAENGLKGHLQGVAPWIEMFWCLAHRLELALKDALKGTPITNIDEMLLRLYYLYEKSPKKCRELESVIEELQACLTTQEFSKKGGSRPVRACGTRFITHKVAALDRYIDRFGAYVGHVTSLVEDSKTKAVDRQRLKGYVLKWRDAKMLLGSAYFCDILKASSILCKVLQEDDVCVVRAIEALVKAAKQCDKLKDTDFDKLPTVKRVLDRITQDADDSTSHTYQEVQLKGYVRALTYYKNAHQKSEFLYLIQSCLRDRIKIQSTELLTHAITILATHGWEKSTDPSFGHEALEYISTRFQVPLENANVDCSKLCEEWEDILDYARRFLNLMQDYKITWWKLFNSSDSSKWENILAVAELLFCLPVSNGHLERIFSQVKLIKSERRSCLGEDKLDELVRINVESPPLSKWDSESAVDLWWRDKIRRVNVSDRASSSCVATARSSQSETNSDDKAELTLESWESWLDSDSDSD